MNFAQLVHTLRYIFRCGGKFNSVVCGWKGSNSKWPPLHYIKWWTAIGFGKEYIIFN